MTGIVIGGIAYQLGFSPPTCLLSVGLCSMAGMLPDIDSDSSRSFQECIYFAAGLCAVLCVDRLRQFHLDRDIIILWGATVFLFVRFGIGGFIKKLTAHRGMFHSIPAAVLAGEVVFFLSTGTIADRGFKGFSITAGYLSHLILDEICSIDSTGKTLRLKKSFGTALKWFDSKRTPVALGLYAAVVFLGTTALKNPDPIAWSGLEAQVVENRSAEFQQRWKELLEKLQAGKHDAVSAIEEGARLLASETASATSREIRAEPVEVSAGSLLAPIVPSTETPLMIPRETAEVRTRPLSSLSHERQYSEHRLFSRKKSEIRTASPSLPETTTLPIPNVVSMSPSTESTRHSSGIAIPAQPALPQANYGSTNTLHPSGRNFMMPSSSQFTAPLPQRAPAPLLLP